MHTSRRNKVATAYGVGLALILAPLLGAGCGSADGSGGEGPGPDGTGSTPVVLVAERVQQPDARNIYITLHPELPSEPTDRSTAYEFGSVDVHVHDGKIFLFDRETVALTRYVATDSYELEVDVLENGEQAKLSFQREGLPGFGFRHVFVSPTRAYLVDWSEYRVIVWNPTTMELSSTIDLSLAVKDDFVLSESYLVSPVLSNGKVFIGVYVWQNYEAATVYPGAGVIALDAETDEAPVLLEDPRITGAAKLMPTSDGRLLVVGDQYSGMYGHFATEPETVPPAGILAIDTTVETLADLRFEEDYFVDLLDLTGSPAIYASYQVDDSNVLLQSWDPASPMDAMSLDDYWAAPQYVYLLADLEARAVTPVSSIPKALAGSVDQFQLDGELYVQTYAEAGEGGSNSDSIVHRVQPQGVTEAFRVPGGDLWALERIR